MGLVRFSITGVIASAQRIIRCVLSPTFARSFLPSYHLSETVNRRVAVSRVSALQVICTSKRAP